MKVKEEKDASSMAPGSPPTPPHTPQSPQRAIPSLGNLSQSCQTSNANSPNLQQQQQQQQSQQHQSQEQQQQHPIHAVTNSPLSQILVQNPALAQLLQQNPAILSQNPQLAQLLQQNLQAQMGSVLFQNVRREESEDSRVSLPYFILVSFQSSLHFGRSYRLESRLLAKVSFKIWNSDFYNRPQILKSTITRNSKQRRKCGHLSRVSKISNSIQSPPGISSKVRQSRTCPKTIRDDSSDSSQIIKLPTGAVWA